MPPRRCKAPKNPQFLTPSHLRKKAAPAPTHPSIGHKTDTSRCLRTHTRNGGKWWSNCSGQTWLFSSVLVAEGAVPVVYERIRFRLTLIMFPKKVKPSEIALQMTDTRIEVDQKKQKPFASSPLLAVFPLLFLALGFSSPSTAGATVAAYMDVQGNLHYVRGKSSRTYRKVANNRPVTRPTRDSSAQTINAFIQAAATEHGVDPLLIKAVIKAESNFDPSAVSPKGAQGLMQLMPTTARDLQVADPFDPQENITGGTKYLRYLLDSYDGDVELSLAAYNAGPGNIKGAIPNIPETRAYIAKVLDNYQSYRVIK